MRILVISKEAWRDEQNGGNVLSNIFADFDAEFAQIYCNEREPNNNICRRYYRITDKQMFHSIISRKRAGGLLEYESFPKTVAEGQESYSSGKKWFGGLLPILRELVWWGGKWNNLEIERFVREFNPDIIFAPCYGSHYMHKLTRLVHYIAKVNVISYISDDHYTNHQLHWAPWYWINHFLLRKHTQDIFRHYSLVYTMTDEQKRQCEKDFGAHMKILRKAGTFNEDNKKNSVGNPIKLVYAGGIYLNRWKTLKLLADAMRKINKKGLRFTLDIYTNNPLTKEISTALNDGFTSKTHPVVSTDELRRIYKISDVALHCESFDIVNRLTVRLSFSTKIVDCLDSGCAVMAICDCKQAGFTYLKQNNAAICISDPNEIEPTLQKILERPDILIEYQHKAFDVGRKNHTSSNIKAELISDFNYYADKQGIYE